MNRMRQRALIFAACTASLALSASAPASAANQTFTTNGGATSITATRAILNGSFQVSQADSAWAFQYGTTTAYGRLTPAQTIQPGFHAVAAEIKGLAPGTTYHFRLVVYQVTTTESPYSTSDDKSFQTKNTSTLKPPGKKPGYGTAKLRSRSLLVHRGTVAVPLHCSGKTGASCRGVLTVRTVGQNGRSVRCAGSSFSLKAARSRTLHPGARSGCIKLLTAARRHRIPATLLATFSTHQASLSVPVTLHQ